MIKVFLEDGIISTKRLLLRKVRISDTTQVFHIFSQASVAAYYDCDRYTDISQATQWLEWNQSLYKGQGLQGFRWAITFIDDPCTLIGSCGIHCVNASHHSLEIGYELAPEYWGKGIMHEALSSMIQVCFQHEFPIQLNRISATTHLNNLASVRVLKKLGFIEEGVLREYGYWKGEYQTVRLFSLLKRDWMKGD